MEEITEELNKFRNVVAWFMWNRWLDGRFPTLQRVVNESDEHISSKFVNS